MLAQLRINNEPHISFHCAQRLGQAGVHLGGGGTWGCPDKASRVKANQTGWVVVLVWRGGRRRTGGSGGAEGANGRGGCVELRHLGAYSTRGGRDVP